MSYPPEDYQTALASAGAIFDDLLGPPGVAHFGDLRAEYAALVGGAGLVDLGQRSRVELAGADRATVLHNLCTNEIKALAPSGGTEAFLTTVQGKTLAHVQVFVSDESIVLDSASGQGETIRSHLDRYVFREDAQIADISDQSAALLVTGPNAAELLHAFCDAIPETDFSWCGTRIADSEVVVARVPWTTAPCFLITAPADSVAAVWHAIRQAGAVPAGNDAWESLRIESGTPIFGVDIADDNLPQEVGRNDLAISFVKGCYLGQETVARIDALGHVNKMLCGVRFDGDKVPVAGTEFTRDGKPAGKVTSAVFSQALQAPLALAYVRRGSHQLGSEVATSAGCGQVVSLPLSAEGR